MRVMEWHPQDPKLSRGDVLDLVYGAEQDSGSGWWVRQDVRLVRPGAWNLLDYRYVRLGASKNGRIRVFVTPKGRAYVTRHLLQEPLSW